MESNNTPQEQAQEIADNPKITEVEKLTRLVDVKYLMMMQYVKDAAKKLSSRNVTRALLKALDMGVDKFETKLTNENEAKLAGVIAQLLDLRNLKHADKLREQELNAQQNNNIKGETNNEQSTEQQSE